MEHYAEDDNLAEAVKYNFKFWWAKLSAIEDRGYKERASIYLRALRHLPGSYKLWYNFLTESMEHCKGKCIISASYRTVNHLFEKCLVFMHKMPRIWILYLEFVIEQKLYNKYREVLDRSLCALPLTQHYKIWEVVSERTKEIKEGKIGKHILERYLKLNQDFMEDYVEYLKSINDWREASSYLAKIINDDRFVSSKGKSHYEFCMELCKMLSTYPDICIDVDGEKAIRYCIGKYTDEVGNLWVYLAEYYVRQGLFEKGRDMFEQALEKVSSARDFGIVYSAYLKFEEELLTLAMEDQDVEEGDDEAQNEDQVNSYLDELLEIEQKDRLDYQAYRVSKEELSIKRVESLIERREILLNSCLIRQNPNSIDLWTKRLTILESDKEAYQRTFHECLLTVDPFKADGKLSSIWVMFAEFYEKMGDIVSANKVFWKAVSSVLKNPEEYVNIWVSWIETLLRVGAYKDTLDLIRYPLTQTINEKKQNLVYSNKLWSLYLDLEINFGNRETVRAVYMKMIDLAVITPLNLLNFAYYLIENDSYEECFRIFERGLSLFKWPALHSIWLNYLTLIIDRFKDKKIERIRDLFERAIDECPEDKSSLLL